jgi:hypothetical protein
LSDFFAGCQVKSSELRSVIFALDLVPKAIYRLSDIGAMKNRFVSRRIFSLVAIGLISSLFYTAVAHACSDLRSRQLLLQPACNHMASEKEPLGKKEKDNCDSVRYGMLSTKASSSHPELFKLFSISLDHALLLNVSLPDTLPLLWRSEGPPLLGLGVSPRLSHVVLRI